MWVTRAACGCVVQAVQERRLAEHRRLFDQEKLSLERSIAQEKVHLVRESLENEHMAALLHAQYLQQLLGLGPGADEGKGRAGEEEGGEEEDSDEDEEVNQQIEELTRQLESIKARMAEEKALQERERALEAREREMREREERLKLLEQRLDGVVEGGGGWTGVEGDRQDDAEPCAEEEEQAAGASEG
jgi:DNA repair exonuclease SbcCD ATPase subunit